MGARWHVGPVNAMDADSSRFLRLKLVVSELDIVIPVSEADRLVVSESLVVSVANKNKPRLHVSQRHLVSSSNPLLNARPIA